MITSRGPLNVTRAIHRRSCRILLLVEPFVDPSGGAVRETMDIAGATAGAVAFLALALVTSAVQLRLRRWRRRLFAAMTAHGGHRDAAVGLLTEGTFAAPGLLSQRRFGKEDPLSWVGVIVRDDAVEIWELERSRVGRPLKLDATPVRTFRLSGDPADGDVRVDADRAYPRLWIRWRARGQLACAGFVPVRDAALVRLPLREAKFASLARALESILPVAPAQHR